MTPSRRKLDEWVRRVAPRAIAYATTLLGRPERAEDVVQDVLLRLLGHPEYDLLRDGERLLFRSVTNACINARQRAVELRSLDEGPGEGTALPEAPTADAPADPVRAAENRELLRAVEAELAALPPMQRAAVELKAMGNTLREIAEALNVTAQNAGVLVHRGRRRLREGLGAALPGGLR